MDLLTPLSILAAVAMLLGIWSLSRAIRRANSERAWRSAAEAAQFELASVNSRLERADGEIGLLTAQVETLAARPDMTAAIKAIDDATKPILVAVQKLLGQAS